MVSLNHPALSVRIPPSLLLLLYRLKLPALSIGFGVLFFAIMVSKGSKRKRKSADEIIDSDADTDLDSNPPQPPVREPTGKRRGRPLGSKNKAVVIDAGGIQEKESGDSGSKSSKRKNPERLLKGKGGELTHKQNISNAIDPTELKSQAKLSVIANSPIPSSTPMNPIAPVSLKPPPKKRAKNSSPTPAAMSDAQTHPVLNSSLLSTSSEAASNNAPKSFLSNVTADPRQNVGILGHNYPAYSLAISDSAASTEDMVSAIGGAQTTAGITVTKDVPGMTGITVSPALNAGQGGHRMLSALTAAQIGGLTSYTLTAGQDRASVLSTSTGTQAVYAASQSEGPVPSAFTATRVEAPMPSVDSTEAGRMMSSAYAASQAGGPVPSAFTATRVEASMSSSFNSTQTQNMTSSTYAAGRVGAPTSTTASITDGSLCHGFQPPLDVCAPHTGALYQFSVEDTAHKSAPTTTNAMAETHQASSMETNPLDYSFNFDVLSSISLSETDLGFSFPRDNMNGLQDDGPTYLGGNQLVWSENPHETTRNVPDSNCTDGSTSAYLLPPPESLQQCVVVPDSHVTDYSTSAYTVAQETVPMFCTF